MSEPKSILSTILITAETDEEANYLAGPVELYWARLHTGDIHSPFPTLEEASNMFIPQMKTLQEYKIKIVLLSEVFRRLHRN